MPKDVQSSDLLLLGEKCSWRKHDDIPWSEYLLIFLNKRRKHVTPWDTKKEKEKEKEKEKDKDKDRHDKDRPMPITVYMAGNTG
jgi:hypothetical protein